MNFWTWGGFVIGFLIGVHWRKTMNRNKVIELESESQELKARIGDDWR